MEYSIVISERAERELAEIVDYIIDSFQDVFAAKRTYDAIVKKIHHLATFPKSSAILQAIDNIDFRAAHVKNFAIIYHIDDQNRLVKIHSILYARRNLLDLI